LIFNYLFKLKKIKKEKRINLFEELNDWEIESSKLIGRYGIFELSNQLTTFYLPISLLLPISQSFNSSNKLILFSFLKQKEFIWKKKERRKNGSLSSVQVFYQHFTRRRYLGRILPSFT
jgi:hypothetical protein